jgi:molybdopterin-binding protein
MVIASAGLDRFLRAHWGVRPATAAPDLGGSVNLNLLVTDNRSLQVARVYRPVVTGQRVAVLQAVRRYLTSHGVPCAGPIPARGGRGWETFHGRVVEVEPFVAAPAAMHTLARVRSGLAVLGRIHALLQAFPAGPAAAAPRARNQIPATVTSITTGEAIANVELDANGVRLVASITVEAVRELGLAQGSNVTAVIKASDVLVATCD